MDPTKLKAHVFDAEQALTWARQAIEEGDTDAMAEAITAALKALNLADLVLLPDLSSLSDAEIAKRISGLLDMLKWFHDHGIKLNIRPQENGWTVRIGC